jgi:hypothetical protein
VPNTSEDDLTWIRLEDFTPGIISNSNYAGGPVPGNKLGQAQSAVGCIALPNGGLAPLPTLGTPIAPNDVPSGTTLITTGLFVTGPVYANFADPIVLADSILYSVVGWDGTNWDFYLEKIEAFLPGGPNRATLEHLSGADSAGGFTGGGAIGMMTGGQSTYLNTAFTFLCAFLNITGANTDYIGQGYQWLYPDPTNDTSDTPYTLIPAANAPIADGLTHQNRLVVLQYLWYSYGASGSFQGSNEFMSYTDPPNSLTYGAQDELFVAEHPTGVGAWGSLDASELFMVKNLGGGYLISGDLNNPVVSRLPGVTSTYGVECRTAETQIGIVYASKGRGLWAWNGGTSSVKISEQLNDDFFIASIPLPVFYGPTVDICSWGDWIVCTNDWLFDTNTGGWWQLSPGVTSPSPHLLYGASWDGETLYAAPVIPTVDIVVDQYKRSTPASAYTWESYPVRQANKTNDKPISVHEVVVRAQGVGTITVTLTGIGGSSSSASPSDVVTIDSPDQPVMTVLMIGLTAQDVTIELSVAATTPPAAAPVVFSVAIGYTEMAQYVSPG